PMREPAVIDDVMSRLAGIVAGSPVAKARAMRPDVIRYTQTSDEAMLRPKSAGGFTRAERAAIGIRIARRLEDGALIAHYQAMLRPLDPSGALLGTTQGVTPTTTDRWSRMLAHADRLTADPGGSEPAHLKLLGDAGLSPQAIVALSQLIAYVN